MRSHRPADGERLEQVAELALVQREVVRAVQPVGPAAAVQVVGDDVRSPAAASAGAVRSQTRSGVEKPCTSTTAGPAGGPAVS